MHTTARGAYDLNTHTKCFGWRSTPDMHSLNFEIGLNSSGRTGTESTSIDPVSTPGLHVQLEQEHNPTSSVALRILHVRRQLRLMFIYPLVYTLMWLITFVHHCTMYKDRYVKQPVWGLRLGATICLSSMGLIDCLILFLRESPWRRNNAEMGSKSPTLTLQPRTRVTQLLSMQELKSCLSNQSARRSNSFARTAAAQASVRLELERVERLGIRNQIALNRAA